MASMLFILDLRRSTCHIDIAHVSISGGQAGRRAGGQGEVARCRMREDADGDTADPGTGGTGRCYNLISVVPPSETEIPVG